MPHYQVYLETSAQALEEGGYLAHMPALVGCVARGKTKEEAIEKTREAMAAYLALMRQHGVRVPSADEAIELKVTETDALTLPPDYAPMSDQELDDLWHLAHTSREALLDTLAAMSSFRIVIWGEARYGFGSKDADDDAKALNWRADPQSWSVRNVLEHMARADVWYASRLEEGGLPELLWRLAATRDLVMNQLHSLPSEARAHVTKHDDEEWTPRKVARRMLEHEQEHLQQIREILDKHAGKD